MSRFHVNGVDGPKSCKFHRVCQVAAPVGRLLSLFKFARW